MVGTGCWEINSPIDFFSVCKWYNFASLKWYIKHLFVMLIDLNVCIIEFRNPYKWSCIGFYASFYCYTNSRTQVILFICYLNSIWIFVQNLSLLQLLTSFLFLFFCHSGHTVYKVVQSRNESMLKALALVIQISIFYNLYFIS